MSIDPAPFIGAATFASAFNAPTPDGTWRLSVLGNVTGGGFNTLS